MATYIRNRNEKLMVAIGEVVAALRKEQNLTQDVLAQAAEVHRTYICDIERGHRSVGVSVIAAIAKAVDTTLEEFFMLVEKKLAEVS